MGVRIGCPLTIQGSYSSNKDEEETPPEFEDGDRIFVTTLHRTPEEVQATSTISQRLAEAFKRNSNAA